MYSSEFVQNQRQQSRMWHPLINRLFSSAHRQRLPSKGLRLLVGVIGKTSKICKLPLIWFWHRRQTDLITVIFNTLISEQNCWDFNNYIFTFILVNKIRILTRLEKIVWCIRRIRLTLSRHLTSQVIIWIDGPVHIRQLTSRSVKTRSGGASYMRALTPKESISGRDK